MTKLSELQDPAKRKAFVDAVVQRSKELARPWLPRPSIALCNYAEPEGDTAMKCTWAANTPRPPWMMKPKKGPTALITAKTCAKCEAFKWGE